MTELSPAAQAVQDAAANAYFDWDDGGPAADMAAAVLRAVADEVVPQELPFSGGMRPGGTGALTLDEAQKFQRSSTRRRLLAIANELEAHMIVVQSF